mmetsp:Transcript_18499/g.30246  ORF Transcript_18499/g.30246 Transcript_18499/m.30246 type:complete len:262 (+) Transcript_18499:301-1086(+)
MFLRGNLARFGTCNKTAPHGTAYYLAEADVGISAVLGITNQGYLMAQAPETPIGLWMAFRHQIIGRTVLGMTGVPEQVQDCLTALDLWGGPWLLLRDEPLYYLDIADLASDSVQVRRAADADLSMLVRWFGGYESDVGQAPVGAPPSLSAKDRAARAINSPDVVLFEMDGVPVSMAGINARLSDIVQIGGVYTPSEMRGRGYARRAVAGLLQKCEAEGVTQSVLYAANEAAVRAYEPLGYRQIGQYRVALLQTPTKIGDPS